MQNSSIGSYNFFINVRISCNCFETPPAFLNHQKYNADNKEDQHCVSQRGNLNTDFVKYRVFIKHCVFSKISKYIPDSGLSRFFLGVYNGFHAWTTKWQVEHQRCSRTGRVKKIHKIIRNTIFN